MQSSLVIITDFLAIFKSCGTIIFPGSHVAFDGTCDVSSDATCKEALPIGSGRASCFFYFSSCSVARWGATFGAFRGIGRGGLRLPSGVFAGAGSPSTHRCEEGRSPSGSKSSDLAPRSSPWVGLPGPHPGFLSFHDERNQRRARGAAPGPRWGAIIIPPATLCVAPPRKR